VWTLSKLTQERKNSLWKFGVLSRFLPVTIRVIKPKNEVFFAEDLVRAAIPGVQQSGRSLAVAGLHVSFGAPVEATDTAISYQLQKWSTGSGKPGKTRQLS
jgi:hypothetical protein